MFMCKWYNEKHNFHHVQEGTWELILIKL
jgi:hypothetical protein